MCMGIFQVSTDMNKHITIKDSSGKMHTLQMQDIFECGDGYVYFNAVDENGKTQHYRVKHGGKVENDFDKKGTM